MCPCGIKWYDTVMFPAVSHHSASTHWGQMTHIGVSKLPAGILLSGPLWTKFSEILIEIPSFSFKKLHLKMSSAKWRLFCPGINDLMQHNCVSCRGSMNHDTGSQRSCSFPPETSSMGSTVLYQQVIPFTISHIRLINSLRPRQNGRHFLDDTFRRIFLNENITILIKISLKFVPKGPINNCLSLV